MPPVRPTLTQIELPPFDPLNRRAAELRAEGHHVISLGQAVPFFPPPEAARRAALQWSLQRGSRSGRVAWQFARDWAGRQRLKATVARRKG